MKITAALLLPVASAAFAPVAPFSRIGPAVMQRAPASNTVCRNEIDDVCDKVVDTTEEYVGKADSLVINRAMRVANHAPILVTLKTLADKAGMSISQAGINGAPEAFGGLSGALSVPTWTLNVFALAAISQIASVARSALNADGDELSQADITSAAVTNWSLARMVGSANPLRDTVIAAVVSGHALRNNEASDGSVTIHNAASQIISAMTSTVAVLGVVGSIVERIPVVGEIANLPALVGVLAMHALNRRADNGGTVRKAVQGGVLAGMLLNAVRGGISFAFDVPTILSNVGLVGLAYVAYNAVDNARQAVMN